MIGTKELCALLLSAGLGAGGVAVVHKAKAPPAKSQSKKISAPRQTVAPKLAPPAPRRSNILDCPAPGFGPGLTYTPIPPIAPPLFVDATGPGWVGGGVAPGPEPIIPGVPEPGSWAMMLAGFGCVAVALRRRKGASHV